MAVRERRALTQVGGAVRAEGEPDAARVLAHAMQVEPHQDRLTHGFHTYPARLHPDTAARLLSGLAPGAVVFDPFAGGGTVLVEAVAAGLTAYGADLSPLAVRLSRVKTWLTDEELRGRLVGTGRAIADRSFARVRARVPARAPLGPELASWYAPNVLIELAGLLEELEREPRGRVASALVMVLSSLFVKVSRRRSDTSAERVERRIRKGLSTEMFGAKVLELAERLEALARAVPRGTPEPVIVEADARELESAPGPSSLRGRVARIVTSPPYGGTYDYASVQELRAAWLGLDDRAHRAREIGARRHEPGPAPAVSHEQALARSLAQMRPLLRPDGTVVLVLGDGRWGQQIVSALETVRRIAPAAGFRLVAAVSQERRDFVADPSDFDRLDRTREEHAIWLAPAVAHRSRSKN